MTLEEKEILKDFNKFLIDCWKEIKIDESTQEYADIKKKEKDNNREIIMAIKLGELRAASYIQDKYAKEVIEKIIK